MNEHSSTYKICLVVVAGLFALFVACSHLALLPKSVVAQANVFSDLIDVQGLLDPQTASLLVSPRFPEPGEIVEIALPSTVTNVSGSVAWFVDEVRVPSADNERSLELEAGSVGTTMLVEVLVISGAGAEELYSTVVTPALIDLVVEADTVTPYFYQGRSLPTRNAPVTITAIPHLLSSLSYDAYTYKWTVDRKVLFSGPQKGAHQVEIQAPLARTKLISVEITDSSGRVVANKTVGLSPEASVVEFYKVSPLGGMLPQALEGIEVLEENEVGVRAVPYHFDKSLLTAERELRWALDGRRVTTDSADPFFISLQSNEGGSARLSLSLISLVEYLQYAEGDVTLQFSE